MRHTMRAVTILIVVFAGRLSIAQQQAGGSGCLRIRFPALVRSVAISANRIAAVGNCGELYVWTRQGEVEKIHNLRVVKATWVSMNPYGIEVGGDTGHSRVMKRFRYDGEKRTDYWIPTLVGQEVSGILYSAPKDQVLVSAGTVLLGYDRDFEHDPQNRQGEQKFHRLWQYHQVTASAVSKDGLLFAIAEGPHVSLLHDNGAAQGTLQVPVTPSSLAVSPDGRTLAVAGGSSLYLYDLSTGRSVGSGSYAGLVTVAFSPTGQCLAAATSSGILLCDPVSLRPLATLASGQAVTCLAFSPDGKVVVAGIGREVWVLSVQANQADGRGAP